MNPSIEILVHISGPSRGPDDTRYRKEAHELLNFQPVSRHEIISLQEKNHSTEGDATQQSNTSPGGAEAILVDELLSEEVETTVQGIAESNSVDLAPATAASSPYEIGRKRDPAAPQGVKRPISHVLIERTPGISRRNVTHAPTTPAAGGPPHRRTVSDSWRSPPSVIPDSQPSPPSAATRRILSSPCLRRPGLSSSSPSPSRDDESRNYKRQRIQEGTITDRVVVNNPSVEGPPVNSSSGEPFKQTHPRPLHSIKTLEIHPPRPRSSKDQYDSHLTPSLRTISEKLPMQKYFNPIIQSRLAEKLERGHWLVSIHSWETALKVKFWAFLRQFIEEGRAGWGVWCSREFLGDNESSGGGLDNLASNDVIRLYCWGEVLGPIWVLLFIASEREIQGVGARWIDAIQEIVVQMD